MPKPENLAKMLADGGDRLTFSIKAHQTLTHKIEPTEWKNEAGKFIAAIEPLREAGRLEAVLFQFPFSFHYIDDNRVYLGKLLTCFKDVSVPVAVEFRGSDWYTSNMIEGMKGRKVPLVSLDMPELKGLPPSMDVVTADTAYIRFHGRNNTAWYGKDAHAQYDYLYADAEIEAWAGRIEQVAEQTQRVLIYFNNHPFGKAAKNAQTLGKMLEKMGLMTDAGGKEVKHGGTGGLSS
jgi:uncharacterized protein YecE (DUF72 family)